MNLDTYEKLKINRLNTSFVPTLKGATGHDMLARGITTFDFTINEHTFTNSFIVCTKMSRPIILGRDFTIPNAITVGWTRHGTKKLCMDDKLVLETEENFEGKTLALSRSICIPPRCTAVVEVTCLSKMDGKFQVQPSPVLLRDNPSVYCKPIVYNMTPNKAQIEKSLSPWASLVVIVPKKSGPGEPPKRRMCVDYHHINALQTKVDSSSRGCMSLYPLPKIDEMFAKLCSTKIFTTLDLCSGYYHIGLTDEAKLKIAFITPHGKWHFNMVPFGLALAPSYFQQLMNQVLQGLDFAIAYLDDIVIFSNNKVEHLQHLEAVFKRLQDAGLKLKESKCDFFRSQIHYLGHMLSAEGIQPLPEKLDSITNMPAPENQTKVKQFLGLVGYYRKFVPHFSDISRPLSKLMRKDTPFAWTKQCHMAFNMLKDKLCEAPILHYPDCSKPYTLFTDASKHGWVGVLMQEFETEVKGKVLKELHPVGYVSGLF